MADPLELAKRDLADKEEAIRKLDAEADRIRGFIEMYGHYVGDRPIHRAANGHAPRNKKDTITENVAAVIREKYGPVPLRELHEALDARGVEIGTKNPRQTLSQVLNRSKQFKTTDKGWTMVDWKGESPEVPASELSIPEFRG